MKKDKNGIFITFEGCEGCGKTTQIGLLAENLQNINKEIIVTREPGGTQIGEMIRNILIGADSSEKMCPETELLLFAASRAQLVRELIVPNLDAGKVILCDRFLDSTTVYQGVARQLKDEPVQIMNRFAVGSLIPDMTIVLDIPAGESIQRVKRRATSVPDRMERETIGFYQAVRDGYLWLSKNYPNRFFVVDGMLTKEEIADIIWTEIEKRFLSQNAKN